MKWITHQTGAVVTALALAMPLPALGAVWVGSLAPDIIDQRISRMAGKKRQKTFNRMHRGSSHWYGWWLLLFLSLAGLPLAPLLRDVLSGFAFGGLSHIQLDLLTTRGVPLWPFSRKNNISLRLCATGQWREYLFLGFVCLAGLFFAKYYQGGLF